MKILPLLLTALIGLASCSTAKEPAPDPFLGHWQSETMSYVVVDAAGQVTNPGATSSEDTQLEVTATTLQFTVGTGSDAVTGVATAYSRNGEVITFGDKGTPARGSYVRSLTTTTFTYEDILTRTDGSAVIRRHPFHR